MVLLLEIMTIVICQLSINLWAFLFLKNVGYGEYFQ